MLSRDFWRDRGPQAIPDGAGTCFAIGSHRF